ncbi:MAG: DUF2092 domain-containing protein, partial [Planctomycetota bacterium]
MKTKQLLTMKGESKMKTKQRKEKKMETSKFRNFIIGGRPHGSLPTKRKECKQMSTIARKLMKIPMVLALSLIVGLGAPSGARADEADAKNLLKAMSNYMASQKAISFDFDATLEVITTDNQKLALASSGAITLNRPRKIRATRAGGHADIEMLFDGKTLTLFGGNLNLYTQIEIPGTIDNLVDVLREEYNRPLPAADLLMSNVYDELMAGV